MVQKMARNPFVRRILIAAALGCILSAGACSSASTPPVRITEEITSPAPDAVHPSLPAPSFTLDQPIENGVGKVTVDDSTWRVKGPDLPAGTHVRVEDIDGVVFVIAPVQEPTGAKTGAPA